MKRQSRPKIPKLKIGEPIWVEFDDHCSMDGGASDPISCELMGRVVEDHPTHLKVATWIAESQLIGSNTMTYTIMKPVMTGFAKVKFPKS